MHFTSIFISITLITTVLLLTACNTTRGIGQDIEAAGEAIEEEARDKGAE